MSPLFEHYGVQLWMPEAGGRVDYASYVAAPPSTTMPTGVTKPGTTPAPNTVVTAPVPSTTSSK